MIGKFCFAAASLAIALAAVSAAHAADLDGLYAPEPAYAGNCPPFGQPKVYYERRGWVGSQGPRLVTANPPPYAFPIYITPQQAHIVSDSCPNEYRQNWYEGKLFYYNAGSPQRPDTFVVYKRY